MGQEDKDSDPGSAGVSVASGASDGRRRRVRRVVWIPAVVVCLFAAALAMVLFAGPIRADRLAKTAEAQINARIDGLGTVTFQGGEFEWLSFADGAVFRLIDPRLTLKAGGDPLIAKQVDLVIAPGNLFRADLQPYSVVLRQAALSVDASDTVLSAAPEDSPPTETPKDNDPPAVQPVEPDPVRDVDFEAGEVPLPPRRPDTTQTAEREAPPEVIEPLDQAVSDASGATPQTVPSFPVIPVDGLAIVREMEVVTGELAYELNALFDEIGLFGLTRIELVESSLAVDRGEGLPPLDFFNLNARLTKGDTRNVSARAMLARDDFETPIAFSIALRDDGRPKSGTFQLAELTLDQHVASAQLPLHVSTPISVSGALDFDENAKLTTAGFSLHLASGAIGAKGDPTRQLRVDDASLDIAYEVASGDITIDRLTVESGGTGMTATGRLAPWPGDPSGRQMRLTLNSTDLVFDDGEEADALGFAEMTLEGIVDPLNQSATINRLAMTGEDTDIVMAVEMGWGIDNAVFAVSSAFSQMSLAHVRDIWLPPISPGARTWFRDNIKDGTVSQGTFAFKVVPEHKRAPGAPRIWTRLRVEFEDGVAAYYRDLPYLNVAEGRLRIDSSDLGLDIDRGSIDTPSERRIAIDSGLLEMSGLGFPDPKLTLRLTGTSDSAALIDYVLTSGIEGTQDLTFGPNDVSGAVKAEFDLAMVMAEEPNRRDPQYTFRGKVSDFASDKVVNGRALTDGKLDVTATRTDLTILGDVAVDGIPANVVYQQPLSHQSEIDRELQVSTTLDGEGRTAFGLDLGDLVDGETQVELATLADDPTRAKVSINLEGARARIGAIGWNKPPGRAATLEFVAPMTGETRRLDDLALVGDSIDIRGWLEIADGKGITEAQFSTFKLSKEDSARATLRTREDGRLAIDVAAERLDARRVLRSALSGSGGAGAAGFDLSLTADRLAGNNATNLTGVTLRLSQSAGRIVDLKLSAQVNGRWPVTGEGAGDSEIVINSADGGGLMRFLNFYRWADGGALSFRGAQGAAGGWIGTVKLTDFNVKGEPVIDRYFLRRATAGNRSRNGNANAAAAEADAPLPGSGQSVAFSKMRMDFTHAEGVLTVNEGLVKGPIVGVTFRGTYNSRSSEIGIAGTLVPAYGLNNVVSQVPILGPILGGSQDEGLIGVTFRVGGTVAEPKVDVNAISAVAPGIFRRIFEYEPPT